MVLNADSPIVEEVRRRRRKISERFAHDLKAYARHVCRIELEHRDRRHVVNQVTVVPWEE